MSTAQRDGLLLAASAVVGLAVMNSPLAHSFSAMLQSSVSLGIAPLSLSKTVLHWINDGLMAIFFLLVGIEIKHEWRHGSLTTAQARILPFGAAIGGMVVPALIYIALNFGASESMQGWAIPAATDIAFALGFMALAAPRTAPALLAFLTAVAVLDDLGAIIIIALFYANDLQASALALAGAAVLALFALTRLRAASAWPYLFIGALLWLAVLKSGVHATLAGVVLGLMLPDDAGARVAERIKPFVSWLVLPLFGVANAGVTLIGVSWASLAQAPQGGVMAGVALGLLLGKPIGILLGIKLASRIAGGLPTGLNFAAFVPVACFCGIGFTMALFIASLAFDGSAILNDAAKMGVLLGTLGSLILGTVSARLARNTPATQ
jgi:Na+:H+ antiporter, NhaA family